MLLPCSDEPRAYPRMMKHALERRQRNEGPSRRWGSRDTNEFCFRSSFAQTISPNVYGTWIRQTRIRRFLKRVADYRLPLLLLRSSWFSNSSFLDCRRRSRLGETKRRIDNVPVGSLLGRSLSSPSGLALTGDIAIGGLLGPPSSPSLHRSASGLGQEPFQGTCQAPILVR